MNVIVRFLKVVCFSVYVIHSLVALSALSQGSVNRTLCYHQLLSLV